MVSDREMRKILQFCTPYIMVNLMSLDFLNNNTQKVDGKTPFYDDESRFAGMVGGGKRGKREYVSKRPTIHLKDSWVVRISSSGGVGTVRLTNGKRDSTGKWNIADLLWKGTRDYHIDQPTIAIDVPILYSTLQSAARGSGWKGVKDTFKTMNAAGTTKRQTLIRGHHTGAMTFYNRYTGKMNYNRTFRRGIRSELVTSFKQFILLCVENGIRAGIQRMEEENLLRVVVKDVSVRVRT